MIPTDRFLQILESLANTPTAPFREQWIREVVLRHLRATPGVAITEDRWGNLSARRPAP
jgi:putative aminopeptidase FrvX